MPERLQPLDYEGVSRSVGSKSWADDPESADWPPNANSVVDAERPVRVAKASEVAKTARAVLRRGHAPSFFGLFLFSADIYLRPYELLPSLSFLKTSAFWIALFTLVAYVPTQLAIEGKLTIKPREVKLILLLLIGGLLSIPLATERLTAWNTFLDYLKVVLMFIVMVNVVRTEKRLRYLLLLVLIVSCILSAFALNDYVLGKLVLRGQRIAGIIGGLFQNPNDLALHLVTMIPIAVALTLSSRNPLAKTCYVACAILMIAGVVVTFSRGGFLGLVCVVGVLARRITRRNRLVIGLVMALVLLVFVLLGPSGYGSRLSTTSDDSALARQDDLKRSLFLAARHPLFGVGMGNYVIYSNSNHATHNAYTQVAAEMGLPALAIYLMFLLTPFKYLRKIGGETVGSQRTSRFFYVAVGLEASLVGYMVTSFFASVAFLWYAYYLVAYAICVRGLYDSEQSAKPGRVEVSDGKHPTFDA